MAKSKKIRDRVVGLSRVRAGDLRPNPRNWRSHPKRQRDALQAILAEVGFADAILVRELTDGSLEIIDGHLRQSLDPELVVPVLVLDLDEDEAAKLLLSLDPLAGMAGIYSEPLQALLSSVKTGSEALRMLYADLSLQADLAAKLGLVDPEEIPDPPIAPRARYGDIFSLGEHRLACGDAQDAALVGRLMGRERARLVVTDPPWGVGYQGKTKRRLEIQNDVLEGLAELLGGAFAAIDPLISAGSAIYVFHPAGEASLVFFDEFRRVGWHIRQGLVWSKGAMVLGHSDYQYCHEPIAYLGKPSSEPRGRGRGGWYGGNAETSVLEYPSPASSREHPISKPVALIARLVNNSSCVGDVVLDPFLGSGATLIACEQTGRRCFGVELDPAYVDVAVARWEAFSGHRAKRERKAS